MKKHINKLLIAFIAIVLFSCTDEKGAKDALLDAGYHPISVGGYGLCAGSENDQFITKFKAYSPDCTRIVSGVVCSGFIKGKTIRLD